MTSNERQSPDDEDPDMLWRRPPSPAFGTARTHQTLRHNHSFVARYEQNESLLDSDEIAMDDSPLEELAGTSESESTCFSCEHQSIFCKLHRPHGLPLHSIAERRSQSTTRTCASNGPQPGTTNRATTLRHSSSAPETLSTHSGAPADASLLLLHTNIDSSQWQPMLIDQPSSKEDRYRPGYAGSGSPRRQDRSPSQKPPSSSSPVRSNGLPSIRSAPDLSPKKTMSDALREVARLLRGHSPSKFSTKSGVSGFSMLPPEYIDENRAPSLSDQGFRQVSSGHQDESRSLRDSPSPSELLLAGVHAHGDWPLPFKRLTVRNRSSLDTVRSSASSRTDIAPVPQPIMCNTPLPLFSRYPRFSIPNGTADHSTRPDEVPLCPGSWPSLLDDEVLRDRSANSQYAEWHDPEMTSLTRQRHRSVKSERSSTDYDNFDRLRFSRREATEDPFVDNLATDASNRASLKNDGSEEREKSTLHMPSPVRSRVPARMSLWPITQNLPNLSSSAIVPPRLRSISSMLRIPSGGIVGCASSSSSGLSKGICLHARSISRPTASTGAKLKRKTLPSWFPSNQNHGCWRCELQDFRNDVRQKARSEGYLSFDRVGLRGGPNAGHKSSYSTVSQPIRELTALSSQPSALTGGGRAPVDASRNPFVPAQDVTDVSCSHGRVDRCWRCRGRVIGRGVASWVATKCFCADYGNRAKPRSRRNRKSFTTSKRSLMTKSVSPDRSQAPRLKRVATRSSID